MKRFLKGTIILCLPVFGLATFHWGQLTQKEESGRQLRTFQLEKLEIETKATSLIRELVTQSEELKKLIPTPETVIAPPNGQGLSEHIVIPQGYRLDWSTPPRDHNLFLWINGEGPPIKWVPKLPLSWYDQYRLKNLTRWIQFESDDAESVLVYTTRYLPSCDEGEASPIENKSGATIL